MELGLSLGDASKSFGFLKNEMIQKHPQKISINNGGLDFRISLGLNSFAEREEALKFQENGDDDDDDDDRSSEGDVGDGETPIQLNLLPIAPVPLPVSSRLQSLPWSSDNGSSENGSSGNVVPAAAAARGLDVNRAAVEEVSSANSGGSPFCLDFRMYGSAGNENPVTGSKRDREAAGNDGSATSRGSDDDENGVNNRKKLRLSKEQSAFLEESFKEHNTLNPKQKLGLAKQLNLRPRQVEVWFQNRRARTKLKQTEVDCEYLKRCCDTLTEENRRLHKEVQELRALKASNNSLSGQRPATTLTMCPACERVSTTAPPPPNAAANTAVGSSGKKRGIPFPLNRPRFYPFSQKTTHPHPPNNHPAAS